MKLCPTCGTPHPDDVTTSHHPEGCTCGLALCGGPGPAGCIWMKVLKPPEGLTPADRHSWAADQQFDMQMEWFKTQFDETKGKKQ